MQVSDALFRVVQIVIIICIAVIGGIGGYALLTTDVDVEVSDSLRKAEIERMQATAQTYFVRLNYFEGVCDAVGAQAAGAVCNETRYAYALALPLANGWYCGDSTGFSGVIATPLGAATACNQ